MTQDQVAGIMLIVCGLLLNYFLFRALWLERQIRKLNKRIEELRRIQ